MTIHMKNAKESRFDKTFERRATRMLALVMRTLVKVDFSDKDIGIFVQNANSINIPIGFLKFDDKVWTSNEVHMFKRYIDISTEFKVTCLFLDPEPVTIPTWHQQQPTSPT
jgi:hypothetical protein